MPPKSKTAEALARDGAEESAEARLEDRPVDAALASVRIRAQHPIRYNGKTYGPGLPDGDELDVSPAERDELHALGVLAEKEPS